MKEELLCEGLEKRGGGENKGRKRKEKKREPVT